MSARTIELFRQYTEKERLNQQPEHKSQPAQGGVRRPKTQIWSLKCHVST
jgi:hypothetical protein